jgi:hypothetical protein
VSLLPAALKGVGYVARLADIAIRAARQNPAILPGRLPGRYLSITVVAMQL